jgi:hypothetical protein
VGSTGTLVIADPSGVERQRFEEHSGILQQIAWNGTGDRIATGDRAGTVQIFDIASGSHSFSVQGRMR